MVDEPRRGQALRCERSVSPVRGHSEKLPRPWHAAHTCARGQEQKGVRERVEFEKGYLAEE